MSPLTPAEIFREGGLLSRALPDYEPRVQQLEMAERVAQALHDRHPLLVEAGTGTGKTLGYLVPALLSGLRVVVSTGTRHLQEQLFAKDLPLLQRILPIPFTAVRLKGIANYLCLRRFSETLTRERDAAQGTLPLLSIGAAQKAQRRDGGQDWLGIIGAWRERTETGDRAELSDLPDDAPEWLEASATSETRLAGRCPYFERCFVTRARRAAQKAELIVVNHHLLCADLAVRAALPDARLLPEYDALICDEAHGLEEVATEHFGVTVSTGRIGSFLRDLHRALIDKHLPPDAEIAVAQASRLTDRLFSCLRRRLPAAQGQGQGQGQGSIGAASSQGGEGARLALHAEHLSGEPARAALDLDTALESLQTLCRDGTSEVAALLCRRAQLLRDDLDLIIDGGQRPGGKYVFMLEAREGGVSLRAAPVDVSSTLRHHLYADGGAVVMTSATLAPAGRFEFAKMRLGLNEAEELQLPSPFDYGRQALLYLPEDLPEPAEPDFVAAAARRMAELLALTGGRAFLLFTSHGRMHRAHERLAPLLGRRHLVLRQGDAPKHLLIQRFVQAHEGRGAVLFATASFWEGVDVVGQALQLVVIDKLPFSPPDDPVIEARLRRLAEDGMDPFASYQVPQAALLLKQGFGRLIRHRQDRGIVALLDRRAATRGYGPGVLAGLPASLRRVATLPEVVAFWRQVNG